MAQNSIGADTYAAFDDFASSLFPSGYLTGSGPFAPVSATAATSHGQASARVSGDATPGGAVAAASGWASSPTRRVDNQFTGGAGAFFGTITLIPWTGLRVDADASVRATTTVGYDVASNFYELTYAYAGIDISRAGEAHSVYLDATATIEGPIDLVHGNPGESIGKSGALITLRLDDPTPRIHQGATSAKLCRPCLR